MAGVKQGEGDKLRLGRQAGPDCKGPYQLGKKLGFRQKCSGNPPKGSA